MASPQPVKCSNSNFWYYLTQPNVYVCTCMYRIQHVIVECRKVNLEVLHDQTKEIRKFWMFGYVNERVMYVKGTVSRDFCLLFFAQN